MRANATPDALIFEFEGFLYGDASRTWLASLDSRVVPGTCRVVAF